MVALTITGGVSLPMFGLAGCTSYVLDVAISVILCQCYKVAWLWRTNCGFDFPSAWICLGCYSARQINMVCLEATNLKKCSE